ncbi:MAG: ABC transporter ATP-binding protein [Alphaproteobacteria bacterium]|nr:ABC transporter ATP-binding protein [Alphaproteobacteria bacterium]
MTTSTAATTSGVSVRARGLTRTYAKGARSIDVLRDVDLDVGSGEQVAIVGPSGSGKSTFMHLLGLLDRPTSGELRLDDVEVGALAAWRRDQLRNRRIGFVFQSHNLLPEHDALGNVMIPVRLAGGTEEQARERAATLLEAVGLGGRFAHRPGELSGGEQQRVALARALVMGPGLVLADEPTGNLDPGTAASVFALLLELHRVLGSTLVVVTHSHEIAGRFPRRLVLRDGRFEEA